jgi:hypothetical protein
MPVAEKQTIVTAEKSPHYHDQSDQSATMDITKLTDYT